MNDKPSRSATDSDFLSWLNSKTDAEQNRIGTVSGAALVNTGSEEEVKRNAHL